MKNPIPYGRQKIEAEDKEAVLRVLDSDFLTQGPEVEKFEKAICQAVGGTHAIAVANGTAALHLGALALGVKPGDKVLVTPNTFVASANCIRYCGGDVEFVDIDSQNFCLDLNLLEEKLKKNPRGYKGIVCVDFAGYAVDFEKLRSLADQYGLWIIEDSCHALGAEFQNSQSKWVKSGGGEYADLAIFSFHPVKHVATGEGGVIVTRDKDLCEKLRILRTHGIVKDPSRLRNNQGGWSQEMQVLGYNYRMSDILCALGTSQLKRMEKNLLRRREIADAYRRELSDLPIEFQSDSPKVKNAYHLFVIQTDRRKELYDFLRTKNIFAQVHYPPVHLHPYYQELYGRVSLPKVERYANRTLSLPMYHSLDEESLREVISSVRSFYK